VPLPRGLVEPNISCERLADGLRSAEGPVWVDRDGGYLLFSDIRNDRRCRWDERRGFRVVAQGTAKANGMTLDREGRLVVCEHTTSSLVKEHPDGTRETLATHFRGKELNSPNDVITRSDGTIYFSDPYYGRLPVFGVERERELGFQGVYMIRPGGTDLELIVPEDQFEMPNGLCFSPDESLLYINDTPNALVRVYDVDDDGTIAGGRVLLDGIGSGVIEEGVVDGMKIDERGNVWVSGPGGVWVISPGGEHLGVIEVPENVGNLAWGGRDWKTLFIAASTSVYRIETKVASTPLPYH
jgi:gluconolactonase